MRVVLVMIAMGLMVVGLLRLETSDGPTRMDADFEKGVDPSIIFPPEEVQRLRAAKFLPASGLFRVDYKKQNDRLLTAASATTAPTTRNAIDNDERPAPGVFADD